MNAQARLAKTLELALTNLMDMSAHAQLDSQEALAKRVCSSFLTLCFLQGEKLGIGSQWCSDRGMASGVSVGLH